MIATDLHPHANGPLLHAGARLESARAAVILLHGRGSSSADIMRIGSHLVPADATRGAVALISPQASVNT